MDNSELQKILADLKKGENFVKETIANQGFYTILHRGQTHLYIREDLAKNMGQDKILSETKKIFGEKIEGLSWGWVEKDHRFGSYFSLTLPPMKYHNKNLEEGFYKNWGLFMENKNSLIETLNKAEDTRFYRLMKSLNF